MPNTSWRNCSSVAQWQQLERQNRPSPIRGGPRQPYPPPSSSIGSWSVALRRPTGRGDRAAAGQATALPRSIAARRQAGRASGPNPCIRQAAGMARHGTPPLSRRRPQPAKPPVRPDGPARTIGFAPACGTSSAGRGRACVLLHLPGPAPILCGAVGAAALLMI